MYKISTVSYTKTVIRLLIEMKLILIHNVQDIYFIHSGTRKTLFKHCDIFRPKPNLKLLTNLTIPQNNSSYSMLIEFRLLSAESDHF